MTPRTSLLILLLAALSLPGCGASPLQKVAVAEQTYTAAADNLRTSIEAGLIDDPARLRLIRDLAVETDAALDVAKAAAVANDRIRFSFSWRQASTLLDRLLLELAKAEQEDRQ